MSSITIAKNQKNSVFLVFLNVFFLKLLAFLLFTLCIHVKIPIFYKTEILLFLRLVVLDMNVELIERNFDTVFIKLGLYLL